MFRTAHHPSRRTHAALGLATIVALLSGLTSAQAAGEPTIMSARTADTGDGRLDAVRVTFSDAMTATSPGPDWYASGSEEPGFRVAGYEITGSGWEPAGQPTATTLRLDLAPLAAFDTGATPRVTYRPVAGGPRSAITGLSLGETSTNGVTSIDAAGPVLTGARAYDLPAVNVFNVVGERVSFTFSEPVFLAGAGAVRGANLESAIKLTGVNEGFNGCPFDGTATANQNFPQAGTGTAPISPTSPTEASATLTTTYRTNNVASVQRFIAIPKGCKIGIDPANNTLITDAAGNAASHQNLPTTGATTVRVTPADILLTQARTLDGIVGTPNGAADALDLTFDQNLDDATLSALAQQLTITSGGTALGAPTLTTGATPNDATVRAFGAFGSGLVRVATARASCSHAIDATTTSGAKGPVAFGAPYAACVGNSTMDAIDGVSPIVLSATTVDANDDGRYDGAIIRFSESLTSGSAAGWTLNDVPASTFTIGSDRSTATLTVPEADPTATTTPALTYASQGGSGTVDAAGNELLAGTTTAANGLLARLLSAAIEDLDADGRADLVRVTANRPVTVTHGNGFRYGGAVPATATADGSVISLTFAAPLGGAPADLIFDGTGITDTAGGALPASQIPAATITDAVAPVVRLATTDDSDRDGRIDGVRITFAESVTVSPAGWTLAGLPATSATVASDGRSARLAFPEPSTTTPALTYARPAVGGTTDTAGNATPNRTYTTISGLGPNIVSATIRDLDADGRTDEIAIVTSRPVTISGSPTFTYDGVPVAALPSADGLTLLVAGATDGAPRALSFDGNGITDSEGVAMSARTLAATEVTDAVAPVGTITLSRTAPLSAGALSVQVTFSEPMQDASVTARMGSRTITPTFDANHSLFGWHRSDARRWDGTISISSSDCAVSAGCPVTFHVTGGKDARGGVQVPATLESFVDTIAPAAPVVASAAGDGAPRGYVNAESTSLRTVVANAAGEADGGTAELLRNGASLAEPVIADIAPEATEVTLATTHADVEAFRAALGGEGAHTFSVKLCDAAENCTTGDNVNVVVDLTPVPVEVTEPASDAIVTSGDVVSVAWNSNGLEDATTELAWSADGASWNPIAQDLGKTGTFDWTIPAIDVSAVQIRALAKDAAGNESEGLAPATFAVDSSAPEVDGVALPGFIEPGAALQIQWIVRDATIDRVEAPIVIEESIDGGATWRSINGGAYDQSDDGLEPWNAPSVVGEILVRVTATDAGNRSTTRTSNSIIAGVRGAVVDAYGAVAAYGSSEGTTAPLFTSAYARDVALRSDGRSGYILTASGSLVPFALDGGEKPAAVRGPRLRGIASQLLLVSDASGYVVDRYGRIHRFGGAPAARATSTWVGKDFTRDAVLLPNGRGGYVLDRFGRTHPFKVGTGRFPRTLVGKAVTDRAVGLILRPNERSGWILDARGRLLAFGGAPKVANPEQGQGTAVSGFRVTTNQGYWIDSAGRFHPWGGLTGDPSTKTFRAGTVRNAS